MSKLDAFLWLTVKGYIEVSTSSYLRCPIRTPFLQNTSRRLPLSFYKKISTNLRNIIQTKVQKRIIYGEKKETWSRKKQTNVSYIIEGLAATDKG